MPRSTAPPSSRASLRESSALAAPMFPAAAAQPFGNFLSLSVARSCPDLMWFLPVVSDRMTSFVFKLESKTNFRPPLDHGDTHVHRDA